MKKYLWILFPAILLAGCASPGRWDSSLSLDISPQPVQRGKPALARINAPLSAQKVVGTVETMGSPQLIFLKGKETWYFYGVIPFSPWVKPGVYKVRATVFYNQGDPHYTETRVELK